MASPFMHFDPRVSLDEKNGPTAYGTLASARMDFSAPDLVPDAELSEIVWRSVKGPSAPMPPPVRSAFLRHKPGDDDGDGDNR